jgi:hypothetical protein
MAVRICLVQDLGSGIVGGFLAALMCSTACSHRNRRAHSNDNPANMLKKSAGGAKLAGRAPLVHGRIHAGLVTSGAWQFGLLPNHLIERGQFVTVAPWRSHPGVGLVVVDE